MQAIKNADGRLEVFVRGSDGALNHIWQTAPNNGWSDWETLGIPHPDFRSQDGQFSYGTLTTTPSVNLSADGRLEVFAVGRRDIYHADLVHIWQPAPNSESLVKLEFAWWSVEVRNACNGARATRMAVLKYLRAQVTMRSGISGKRHPIMAGLGLAITRRTGRGCPDSN